MSRRCRECGQGQLQVLGLGPYEDTIEVECDTCGEGFELEPDGLGEAGLEMLEAFTAEQTRRERAEAEEVDASRQVYGFTVPAEVHTFWSARAIYRWHNGEVNTDIPHDRQAMHRFEADEPAKALAHWLNTDGLPGLQAVCQREQLQPHEVRVAEYRAEGYYVAGNPNGSHGYLYLVAYREPVS